MHACGKPISLAHHSLEKIRIFSNMVEVPEVASEGRGSCVFVTIGPGETRITVVDDEAVCERSWTAIFGWGALCALEIEVSGRMVQIDDESLVERAMTGRVRAFGQMIDTTAFIAAAAAMIQRALEVILERTVGSGARYDTIILAAPVWMHGVLATSIGIRPHILREIRET